MKWFCAVRFLLVNLPLHGCLKVANFWQANSGFKSIEFLEVLCRRATELQQTYPSCLSSLVGYPYREKGYQRPCWAKSHKGACSSWGEASSQHWAFWNCFMKSLLCSDLTWVPELGSPGRVRELLAGRARPCSLKDERGLTHYSSGTVFCYLCFRDRWQDSKGRRKKRKQISKLASEKIVM